MSIAEAHRDMEVRIAGGRTQEEGRVEVRPWGSSDWGTVCGDGWGVREAMVVCRELGLRYAHAAMQTHLFTQVGDGGGGQNGTDPFVTK